MRISGNSRHISYMYVHIHHDTANDTANDIWTVSDNCQKNPVSDLYTDQNSYVINFRNQVCMIQDLIQMSDTAQILLAVYNTLN